VDISSAGLVSVIVADAIGNPPTQIINNQLAAGAFPGAISDVAATWTVSNTATDGQGQRINYGSNSLVFNNYAIVPEPSSALFAIGAIGVLACSRR